jgi:integrase
LTREDVDFDQRVIVVRDGKGGKDRVVMLLQSLAPALKAKVHQPWHLSPEGPLCEM